jgi:predicted acylesterase/phospholipase RssA
MMDYCFKNLVFEGGGAKGIAYLGALEVLKRKNILQKIERIGGTSAGAINALLLGLNYSNKELKTLLMDLNFKIFLDQEILIQHLKIFMIRKKCIISKIFILLELIFRPVLQRYIHTKIHL